MAFTQDLFSSRRNYTDGNTRIGQADRIWYDSYTNTLRIGDGNPGGKIITGGSGGAANVEIQDHGITLTSSVTKINFDGNGVVTTAVGDQVLVTIANIGPQGTQGNTGTNGVSVTSANTATGNLLITLSNGTVINAGSISTSTYSNTNVAAYLTGNVTTGNVFSTGYFYANGQPFTSGSAQLQSDYTQADTGNVTYIKNKPDLTVYATTTNLQILNANLGAYQTYANVTFSTVANAASQQTQIDTNTIGIATLNANVGAYQLYANANIGTVTTSVQTVNANLGAYQTTTNANAATQATSINSIDANLGSYQIYSNATFLTQQLQSDYTQANTGNVTYIKNKPDLSVYATQTYVSTEINNLINSAPGTLDTLGEIAANLANEANAITAILNSITNTNNNVTAISANVLQSDWAQSDTGNITYIKNKPDLTVYATQTQLTNNVNAINANIGSFYSFANLTYSTIANAAVQDIWLSNLESNVTTINANIGAFQTYVNANIGTDRIWLGNLEANAGTQATTITNIQNQINSGTVATANVAYYSNVTATSTNATFYPGLYNTQTGNLTTYANTGLTYNPGTGNLSTAGDIVAAGNLYVNSGYIQTWSATGNIFNTGVTTVNFAGGATGAVNIGNASGLINLNGNVQGSTNGFKIGYLDIPQNAQSSTYVLSLTDRSKHIYSTSATNQTVYVPTNANVPFPVGSAVNMILQGNGNIFITANSGVTMFLAGNSASGANTRTMTGYGMGTIQKVATDTWFVVGVGIT